MKGLRGRLDELELELERAKREARSAKVGEIGMS